MRQSGYRYAQKRNRKTSMHTVTAVAAAIVLILVATVFFTGRQAKAGDLDTNTKAGKYYTSYEVQSGDTLWTIAEAYSSGSDQSVKAYVEEVCRINHLSDANQIYAGNRICIPYYKN
ncbi:MAG: LysM peptidoglycan-binding domain-containing protein [Eubacterium sp.]|nr:LysM peptidoglycan-binding domain-containing protein [Eubacterium sp.]